MQMNFMTNMQLCVTSFEYNSCLKALFKLSSITWKVISNFMYFFLSWVPFKIIYLLTTGMTSITLVISLRFLLDLEKISRNFASPTVGGII